MSSNSSMDRLRSILVAAATAGMIGVNFMASAGYLNGITTGAISDRYPTVVTPAGYAFTIWTLIYAGLVAFTIVQALPGYLERFRPLRSLYIASCAVNCAWIYFWHTEQMVVCFLLIVALAAILVRINAKLRSTGSATEALSAKGPFGLYLGWVTAAALVNLAVMLVYLNVDLGSSAYLFGAGLVIVAAALGVAARVTLSSYMVPLAIAWALTAIAVKQSGKTIIVSAAAVGVIACLIAAVSVVMTLKSSYEQR